MAYTVNKLAKLSGVSARTLHFYDEIGLLKPAYVGENNYHYYEEEQLLSKLTATLRDIHSIQNISLALQVSFWRIIGEFSAGLRKTHYPMITKQSASALNAWLMLLNCIIR